MRVYSSVYCTKVDYMDCIVIRFSLYVFFFFFFFFFALMILSFVNLSLCYIWALGKEA